MLDLVAMYEGLRATRDADSCLRGLNEFRKGLRGDGGSSFLASYLRLSPEWQELQAVWDAQLTIQHYHVTVTLLLTLADALGMAAAAPDQLPAEERQLLAAGAAALASTVLQRRLKALYFALSSDVRGKSNAALGLLAAVAAACSGGAASGGGGAAAAPSLRELVRAFDWRLSALPGLARPPREKKGEAPGEYRRRYWQQWELGDPLKRPTRALFCRLALALLRAAGGGAAANALLLQQLLQLRPLMGGLLNHLAGDPPAHQLQVLQALQRRVLSGKAAVPPAVQAEVFSDAALQQLAAIAATAAVEGAAEEEEEEGAEGDGADAAVAASRAQQAAAAAAALEVLLAVATDPSHGLATAPAAAAPFVLADAGSHQLLPGQRRLLRLLLRLRPDSAAHMQLLLAAAGADAALAAALLLALPYSLEPAAAGAAAPAAAAGRWFAHAAVASHLLQLLPASAAPGLQLAAGGGGGAAPSPGGRHAKALLRCCLPPCLHKAALSRGLQHSNTLVRYGTLGLLISAMSALEAVLQDCTAAAAAAPPPQRPGWAALRHGLQQAARQQLPDPTLLLALLAAAEKEGWEQANELQLTAVLRLLLLWQCLLPAALAEANVDAERLMPQQPLALRPQHQLQLLELLHAAADAAAAGAPDGSEDAAAPATTAASAASLLPPLRLLAGSPAAAVRAAARGWLLRRLLGTGAFAGNREEALLWLDLLPRGGEAVCGFLAEAVQLLLRRPHELFELQQQLLAQGGGSGAQGPPQSSLLAPCALRQLLRVLPSAKISAADKAATAAYVAAVLQQLAQQQLGVSDGPSSSAAGAQLAAVLLGVVRQEAARQQQQQHDGSQGNGTEQQQHGGTKDKKRKQAPGGAAEAAAPSGPLQLPQEGRPLLPLLAALEQQEGAAGSEEQGPKKKKKKGQAANAAGTACQVAALADGGAAGDASAEAQLAADDSCCLLISQLAASSSSNNSTALLAELQQRLAAAAARAGGSGGVGTCSAAVRQCLHLLESSAPADSALLLQVLRAAVLATAASSEQQAACLQLLACSSLVSTALAAGGDASDLQQALGDSVAHLLHQLAAGGSAGTTGAAALLHAVAAAFQQQVESGAGAQPAAAARFLLLLPQQPPAVVDAAVNALFAKLLPGSGDGSSKKRKKKEAAAAQPAGGPAEPWLAAAAAAVVQQLEESGRLQERLQQACDLLLHLVAALATAGSATACLLQLLSRKRTQAAVLAALGSAGRQQLLRCCLEAGGEIAARAQAAALLVEHCGGCRQLAAELLCSLLDAGSSSSLALALPAAAALLKQQQEQQQEAAGAVAAQLQRQLLSMFESASGSSQAGADSSKKKKQRGAAGAADASAAQLLQEHALPCLQLALQRSPLAGGDRQRLLTSLLPPNGWSAAVLPSAPSSRSVQPGVAQQAEASVLLMTSGSPSVAELAACVRCFAATLAALFKLPAGGPHAKLEGQLLALLDEPVGDAVAALPTAQRSTPAFAELAAAAAGTLGTAVLRHRLAAAAAEADAAGSAEAAEAGVAAVRALRRFMAALLPEEEEEEEEKGAASTSSDDSSSESESDEESGGARAAPGRRRKQPQQPQQPSSNPEAAAAALQLLLRLLGHSRFLPAMRAAGASPPPLPPAAQAQQRPLASLLPLVDAADGAAAGPGIAAELKKELCELLETLLDLHQRFGGPAGRQEQQQVEAAEGALLPLLMAGYGASCSPTDCAAWSLAAAINQRQWQRQQGAAAAAPEGDADRAALAALLHGPLSRSCFAWGPAAAALQQLQPAAAPAGAEDEQQERQQKQLLQQRLPLDPMRAALTACHWPEACALAVPGSSAAGGEPGSSGSQLAQLPAVAAAYDPGFLLPFAVCCLRQQLLSPRAFAEAGLLSVCLRGLAAHDAACRAAAYQALALFEAQLPAAAAAPGFREAQQLSVLLGALRAAVTRPFQRLPAVHAAFLAEAALLALHPGAAMYPAANKQLTRRAVLSTTDVPLLGQLLLSGGQQAGGERRWMLQLLLAGLRGPQDGALYRRKHAFELAQSLHDSCVAEPAAAALALRLVCTATFIPRAARQLAQESGLIPWLAGVAAVALEQQLQRRQAPGQAAQQRGRGAAEAALAALRRLLQLRAVMRGTAGAAAVQQMAAAACQLGAAAVGACASSNAVGLEAGRQVLPFLREVQQHLDSSAGQLPSHKRPSAISGAAAAELAAAIDSLMALLGQA